MKRLLTAALLSLAAVAMLAAAPARAFTDEAFVEMPIETLVETAPTQHPAALFVLASRLFADERGQEAAGWMYAGQLRYRFMLIADDAAPNSSDAVLFSALMEQVGRPINEHIGGNVDEWIAAIDWALAWDARHDNATTSKTAHADELAQVRSGLEELRTMIDAHRADIARQRNEAGLPNR